MDFRLQEELQALQEPDRYQIPEEIDVEGANEGEIEEQLEGAIESLVHSPENITDARVFDVYRSLLKHFDKLSGSVPSKMLDSIASALLTELDATSRDLEADNLDSLPTHKQALEQLVFLLNWFVVSAERTASKTVGVEKPKRGKAAKKKTQSDEWKWEDQILSTLNVINKVLKLKTHRLWTTTPERDAFINCVTRPAWLLSESETHMKSQPIKLLIYKIICLAVKHHSHAVTAQNSVLQSLQYFDHLSEPMAELLAVLSKEFDHSQLAEEVLRELGAKEFNAQDSKGPRSFSKFLIRLAELSPRLVTKQISLLLPHIDSESYPMRMALVEVTGTLIRELAALEEGEKEARDKKLNNLFELLMERFLDVSSYVRAKVINTLSKICDLPQKFPKQRLAIATMVIAALEDKASSVRRYAIALLTKLILTHPYGLMHGGLLKFDDWETRYKGVCEELDKVEGSQIEKAAKGEGDTEGEETGEEGSEEDDDEDEEDEESRTEVPATPATIRMRRFKRSSMASQRLSTTRQSGAFTMQSQSMTVDGDQSVLEGVGGVEEAEEAEEGDEEDEAEEPEEGEETAVEVEDGEDFSQQFEDEGLVPGTPARTNRSSSQVPMTPKTPARTRVPKTPGTVKSAARTPKPKDRKKKKKKKARKSEALDLAALNDEQVALAALESNHILHLRLRKKYYSEGLDFIKQIEGAMAILSQLLVSTSKAEVLESMEFFRVAHEYQFESAQLGIKKMVHLIWSKDNASTTEDGKELRGIRSKLIECYRNLYFDPLPDLEPNQQVNRIAKNMIQLTYSATLAELTSLEELIRTMMLDGQIHQDVIAKLWQVYSSSKPLPREQRRGAIIILGMLAVANRSVVSERVETLIKIGLGSIGKDDLILARYTMIALQRLNGSVKKVKGSLSDKSVRLPMEHVIFRKLKDAVETPCRLLDWFGMAEQAINTIYALGEHPDRLCDELIKNLAVRAFTSTRSLPDAASQAPTVVKTEREESVTAGSTPASDATGPAADSFEIAQVLHAVGHVAVKHLVFLELVERELKRQKDQQPKESGRQKVSKDKGGEELDQVAGNAEDEIGERMAAVRESEMLYGPQSLLAVFGPLLVQICGSPRKYTSPILRTASTLAFSKFLCVSSQFCDEHHRLLFKILETSKDPSIRSNIVIALGDIAVCFSNIVDENSNELYKGLSDRNLTVKKNTLLVLTHLILNGMIKVKGQLGEMAKCLEDEEPRVADLAKLFFTELATKENAIYNNLPDVISHLSVGEHAVDEEAFQSTMRYIFQFIEKERQAENIVEKLCQRFRLTEDPRQWRDIAFCLSLLPFKSEKSVKRLIEGLTFYQDKLHEEAVFNRFSEILQKARANKSANKPDTELKEFEVILTEFKQRGAEDQDFEKKVEAKKSIASKRVAKRNARKGATKRGKASKQLSSSDEDTKQLEIDDEDDEPPKAPPAAKKRAPARRARAAARATPSSDEEDNDNDDEEEEEPVKPARRAAPPKRNARRKAPVVEDSESE